MGGGGSRQQVAKSRVCSEQLGKEWLRSISRTRCSYLNGRWRQNDILSLQLATNNLHEQSSWSKWTPPTIMYLFIRVFALLCRWKWKGRVFDEQGVDLAAWTRRLDGFGAVPLPQETRERKNSESQLSDSWESLDLFWSNPGGKLRWVFGCARGTLPLAVWAWARCFLYRLVKPTV